ncbi:MAG: hypothetical protein ABEI77_08755 [Halorientalis sp.]
MVGSNRDGNKDIISGEADVNTANRRTALKLFGSAAAALALPGAAGVATASSTYETVTVPAGSTKSFSLGSGDTLSDHPF